jgi:hypothetical protein
MNILANVWEPVHRLATCLFKEARISSPGKIKNFHFSISFRPTLGPTPLLIHRAQRGSFAGGKAAGA